MNILETTQLTKTYGRNSVVHNVSLTIKRGHIYGLIGTNGAGKSTLMKMICGFTAPTSGSIRLFDDVNLRKQQQKIGSMIEAPALIEHMTAQENLRHARLLRGIPNKALETELLTLVGLPNVAHKKTKDFSLGMKQRLGIALSLVGNPDFLLLDEPVNGLDPIGVVEIRKLLKKLVEERNMTILISSHNLPELFQTATDYFIMHQGMLVQTLTHEELEKACQHYLYIESDNTAHTVTVLEDLGYEQLVVLENGGIKVLDEVASLSELSRQLIEAGALLTAFYRHGDTLENYFLSVIGGAAHV